MKIKERHVFILVFCVCTAWIIVQIHTERRILFWGHDLKITAATQVIRVQSARTRTEGSSEQRPIITRRFTKMKYGPVYVFGAVAGNSSSKDTWDTIKVYAMLNETFYKNTTFACCLLYNNDNVTFVQKSSIKFIRRHWADTDVMSYHFTCSNPFYVLEDIPSGVAITLSGLSCGTDTDFMVKPFLPRREKSTKLAIGSQLAFGNISAELIVEWMETYKYLGVDKILTYYYKNLNDKALKVLQYYHNSGLLDLYYYVPAIQDLSYRPFQNVTNQTYNDLTTLIYDTFEMMSGYSYFGVIDFDEFLIPARNETLKHMMVRLFRSRRRAAGFKFLTQYYFTSWGPSGDVKDLIMGRYINTTAFGPMFSKPKLIYKPRYVKPGGVGTHTVKPVKGFKVKPVSTKDGFIRHYRKCRIEVLQACLTEFRRVKDTSMAEWSERIKDRVHYVRKQVFGTDAPDWVLQ